MKFKTKYKLCLLKSYFDKGLGLTNYLKYFIAFFALSSLNISLTLIFAIIYGFFCFLLGYFWFRYGWINAEIEVGNQYNRFVKEVRKKLVN